VLHRAGDCSCDAGIECVYVTVTLQGKSGTKDGNALKGDANRRRRGTGSGVYTDVRVERNRLWMQRSRTNMSKRRTRRRN
jgi:hypothetical protein